MFFKRSKVNLNRGPIREIAWDDKTVEWIAQTTQLNVQITHILKTVSLGQYEAEGRYKNESEWAVHGVMTFPKFIPVHIKFTGNEEQFGGFGYNRMDDNDFNGRKINLPLLEVWLSDQPGQKAELLYAALRDAIMRNSKYCGVRFFKNKDEGLMTEVDKEHGFSYQSRYKILGMVTWLELHANRLPKWAFPTDYRDFSLNTLPELAFDLDKRLEA
jgi:hypothetical protein